MSFKLIGSSVSPCTAYEVGLRQRDHPRTKVLLYSGQLEVCLKDDHSLSWYWTGILREMSPSIAVAGCTSRWLHASVTLHCITHTLSLQHYTTLQSTAIPSSLQSAPLTSTEETSHRAFRDPPLSVCVHWIFLVLVLKYNMKVGFVFMLV